MKCPHCQAENQDGLFCAKCGKPLDDSVSDFTRVMPPLEDLHAPEEAAPEQSEQAPLATAEEENPVKETTLAEDTSADTDDKDETIASEDKAMSDDDSADKEETAPGEENAAANDEDTVADEPSLDDAKADKRKKIMTIAALICGITLAALAGMYLFSNYFNNSTPIDSTTKVKNADTIAPDTSLAEDTIVGYWRHYNTGSVIEKIGTKRYRWTIEDEVYQLDFKDNQYIYEDESGNSYTFVLVNADRIQLLQSNDANGGLIREPVFESGYITGRVGQDGTMTKNLSVNPEAFNIVGRTYADLAGTYGPGSLSVVGDDQYIIFRADGGNFAVQFSGETVPLKKKSNEGYEVVKLTNVTPVEPNTDTENPGTTTPDTDSGTTTTPPTDSGDSTKEEDKEYKVEIPDMPTFPSNTAVATGVVWADLGFVIKNAPDTMSVNDLSAVLGIALEVGEAPANTSGFNFYGSSEGYFAGTYGINDHSYYISGYGKNALSPDKTMLFIQQIS